MSNNLQADIKSTAKKVFLKYGLRSVSIDDICQSLHISKKTFYAYFPTKEELIVSILIEHDQAEFNQMLKKFYAPKKPKTPMASMPNIIDLMMSFLDVSFFKRDADIENFMYDLHKYYPEIAQRRINKTQEILHTHICSVIERGISEGLFRDDFDREVMSDLLAFQYMATILHIFKHYTSNEKIRLAVSTLFDSQLRTLCNQKGFEYYFQRLDEQKKQLTTL